MTMSAQTPVELAPSAWERHPRFTMAAWAHQVTDGITDGSYAEFVVNACAAAGEPAPTSFYDQVLAQRDQRDAQILALGDEVCAALDEDYPREDWVYEVQNEDTRIGFRAWQLGQHEANAL